MSKRPDRAVRKRAAPGAVPAREPLNVKQPNALPENVALDLHESDNENGEEGEDDEDQDAFPEIDANDDEEEQEKKEDEDDGDDDEDGEEQYSSAETGSGFDSDEIENWDEEDEKSTPMLTVHGDDDVSDDSEADGALERMIARARDKPVENEPTSNRLGINRNEAARFFDDSRNEDGSSRGRWVRSNVTGGEKLDYPAIEPEYDSDSSTEDVPNRIGNVPLEWYDDLPHIGYDVDGKRVMRPAKGDELDKFLATVEGDGDAWFSAHDKKSGQDVRLTDEELDIIQRLQRAEIPADYDPYEPATDWFTGRQSVMPMTARPEPKSRFVPSKWEHKKIMKIVRAIRQGRIVAHAPGKEKPRFYNIWNDADQARTDHPMHMPAPKLPLPTHAESYNPPAEYLFSEEERKEWEAADPEDRKLDFMPAKYGALRLVPRYENALNDRFQRCLDLYLAPRMRRKRLEIEDPEDLLPKLPAPRDLRPFPTHTDVYYAHPNGARVRTVAPDPTGTWVLTGADDGMARLWDAALGRCVGAWNMNIGVPKSDHGPVYSVAWCPNRQLALAAVVSVGKVSLIAPPQCSVGAPATQTPSYRHAVAGFEATTPPSDPVRWVRPNEEERRAGVAVHVTLNTTRSSGSVSLVPKHVTWHARGDYFATVCPDAGAGPLAVLIHQVSRHRSQAPFARSRRAGSSSFAVQCACFHPSRPVLFVATQRYVRVFDLVAQQLLKTLQPGVRWISSMDVHPFGDHLLVGSYDRRVLWFDLDLATHPYKKLRYHTRAVRSVAYHQRLPLFATASDDGTVHVFHCTISSDLAQNALLVPLKVLRGHAVRDSLGVLGIQWHPTLPWLLSAGADGDARLWTP